jgi:hypothetical protein
MPRLWFDDVRIWIGGSTELTVNSVQQAARVLYEEWPEEFVGSALYRNAALACIAAVDGHGTADEAREAFAAAAREAGMLEE